MDKNISLRSLLPGERAVITDIHAEAEQYRRLRELGLTNGTPVECVLRRNGISAFLIKGTVIALRDMDSCLVDAAIIEVSGPVEERSCAAWL